MIAQPQLKWLSHGSYQIVGCSGLKAEMEFGEVSFGHGYHPPPNPTRAEQDLKLGTPLEEGPVVGTPRGLRATIRLLRDALRVS
jgi:hypothetical protein